MTKFAAPTPQFIQAKHRGGSQTPRAIVLHGTVSPDKRGTALSIAQWWAGKTSPVTSAHYIVDPGTVIQCVGDHTIAFHCGYNKGSIAIELCDEQAGPASRWDDANSKAILARAATLVAQLCLAYDIPVARPTTGQLKAKGPYGIYGHNDSRLAFGGTTHTDPKDFPWESFLDAVDAERSRLTKAASTPSKAANLVSTPANSAASFDIVVETNNVMSLPLNKKPLRTLTAAGTSSVRMLQEINGGGIKAAARKIPGYALVPIESGDTYSNGILYRTSTWELSGYKYPKEYDGAKGISLTRHMCVAELKHKPTGTIVAFISFHQVTSGSDKTRRRLRAAGLAALRKQIRYYKSKGIPVVVGGDYNGTSNSHPTAPVHVQHKIDHVFAWSGSSWKFARKRERVVNTPSDHDAFVVRLAVKLTKPAKG